MWILPLDFGDTRTNLPPGRYLLPWHYRADSVGRLSSLLCRLLVDITHRVHLPWEALPLPEDTALQHPEHTLVVVTAPPGSDLNAVDARLARVGGRYQLVQLAEPQETGYGWQEQYLQEPLTSAVRRNLGDPEHPLAELGIERLPINYAARLTTDCVELLDLLGDAAAHRLTYAALGTGREEWRQSVRIVAGRRLARRLMQVTSGERSAALSVLLAGPERCNDVVQWRVGSQALQRAGLAWVAGGDVNLGPLARAITDSRVRGAFFDAVPQSVWTPALQQQKYDLDSEVTPVPSLPPAPVPPWSNRRRSGDRMWGEVNGELRTVLESLPAEGATLAPHLDCVARLAAVPGYVTELDPALAEEAVRALREVNRFRPQHEAVFRLKGLTAWLLRFLAMRGADRRTERERAWAGLQSEWGAGMRPVFAYAAAAATSEFAWDLVGGANELEDLERAERISRAALDRAPRGTATAASLLGVLAHLHAVRGENDEALALHEQRRDIYRALGAEREEAVTQARIARIYEARADHDAALALHRAALDVFQRIGADHDAAVSLGDVARIEASRGEIDHALELHRQRLETFERLDARHSRAVAMGDVARILAGRGRLDEALALHEERLAEFTDLEEPQACAIALGDIARIRATRGELDEALTLHRRRLRTFEALQDFDGLAVTHLNIGQVELRRGHVELAIRALESALELNRKIGHVAGLAATADALGRALAAAGRDAGPVLEEAAAHYRKLGRDTKVAEIEALLAER